MLKLVIGNKNYSTWSLRPWLLMHAHSIDFEELQLSLRQEGLTERLGTYSPTSRVPALIHSFTNGGEEDIVVWDSLAICEYVSEQLLNQQGWPSNSFARAYARSICSEMHSGFSALRNELPMNIRAKRKVALSQDAQKDIDRIKQIWTDCRTRFAQDGDYLFGNFSIADCFYAPVVMRFETYSIRLNELAYEYAARVKSHPGMQQWISAALLESEIVPEDEAGEALS